MFFFKVVGKLIGILLIFIGSVALISLIIGLFSVGITNVIHIPGLDLVDIVNTGETPIWLVSLLALFALGIPLFFLFYLGLRILVTNLKSIGNFAKFALLGLWFIGVIGLVIIGIRQASEHAFDEVYIEKTELPATNIDTLRIKMIGNHNFRSNIYRSNNFKLALNAEGHKIIYSSDIDIRVKSTTDSVISVSLEKSADGRDYQKARTRAKNINYHFELKNSMLLLDSYFTTDPINKYSNQALDIVLYIPENKIVFFEKNVKSFIYYRNYKGNILKRDYMNYNLKILKNKVECLNCSIDKTEDGKALQINTPKVKINEDGIEINSDENHLKIDKNGINAESEDVKLNIDKNGIHINTEN